MSRDFGRREPTKGEKFDLLKQQVKQLEMALRVNQMLLKQLGGALDKIVSEQKHVEGNVGDVQYRLVATQNILGVDKAALQAEADRLKLDDFQKASDKEDADKGLEALPVVESQEDVVIITSKTPNEKEDRGFLRSKIQIKAMNQPELQAGLLGKKPGEKVSVTLNGVQHDVELLGVRKVPATPESAPAPQDTKLEIVANTPAPQQGASAEATAGA